MKGIFPKCKSLKEVKELLTTMNGGMLMKSASVVQLLKIAHFLFQKQGLLKNIVAVKHDFFEDEINAILQMVLIHTGIVRVKGNHIYIVNTDHYEHLSKMFINYCHNHISEEEMIDVMNLLKLDDAQVIKDTKAKSVDSYLLLELKKLLQLKRSKLGKFLDSISLFIRAEMRLILLEIDELTAN
jgi:hypothetical protein